MSKWETHQDLYDEVEGGVSVQLYESATRREIARVFRCDRDHTVRIIKYRKRIPDEAMDWLLARALLVLDPFEDGPPLSQAKRAPREFRRREL
jgi:hypothetical protein